MVGLFPVVARNPESFAEFVKRTVDLVGAQHVGTGTDHSGIPRSALSGYEDFPKVAEAPAKTGLKDNEVDAVMGGNYIRVLQDALSA